MSQYNTRKKRNIERVEDECEAPVNMKPIKQEILMWQNKAEVLQNKVNELEALDSELRQQVVELTAQQNDLIPSTSVVHEETGPVDLSSDGNSSTDVESSVTEESCEDSSSSSSSEETHQRRKTKKSKKNKSKKHKKDKKEYEKIKRGLIMLQCVVLLKAWHTHVFGEVPLLDLGCAGEADLAVLPGLAALGNGLRDFRWNLAVRRRGVSKAGRPPLDGHRNVLYYSNSPLVRECLTGGRRYGFSASSPPHRVNSVCSADFHLYSPGPRRPSLETLKETLYYGDSDLRSTVKYPLVYFPCTCSLVNEFTFLCPFSSFPSRTCYNY